jgi:hypothetical protein
MANPFAGVALAPALRLRARDLADLFRDSFRIYRNELRICSCANEDVEPAQYG